jgi:hypothetical protein
MAEDEAPAPAAPVKLSFGLKAKPKARPVVVAALVACADDDDDDNEPAAKRARQADATPPPPGALREVQRVPAAALTHLRSQRLRRLTSRWRRSGWRSLWPRTGAASRT